MKLGIKTNIKDIINGTMKNVKTAIIKAETRANKRIATTIRNDFSKEVKVDYAIKTSAVKSELKITTGRRENKNQGASAIITAKGKHGIPLSKFTVRKTKKGISFTVSKLVGNKTIPHAFLATMQSNHKGIFIREGKKRIPIKGSYANRRNRLGQPILRQPIIQKFGPDVKMLIGSQKYNKLFNEIVQTKYPAYYRQELKYYLGGIIK